MDNNHSRPSATSGSFGKNPFDELPTGSLSLLKYRLPQLAAQRKHEVRQSNGPATNRAALRRQSDSTTAAKGNKEYVATSKNDKAVKPVTSASQIQHNLKTTNGNESQKENNSEELYAQDLLDTLFPPRQFHLKSGNVYVQHVSAAPATRLDVLALHDQLNKELERQRAKECGSCPIRETLYSDCFNEIIRQVAVGCAERGRILYRVKQEIEATKEAYQKLYNSATRHGLRKVLYHEVKDIEEQEELKRLEAEIAELEHQEKRLQTQYEEMHKTSQSVKAEVRRAIEIIVF